MTPFVLVFVRRGLSLESLPLILLNNVCLVCRKLKLDYLDLYLIHWPVSSKPGKYKFPIEEDDFLPMDYTAVWSELEECKRLGLAKCIGVSNFSCKKLQHILSIATIPPSVNQVKPTCSLLNIHHVFFKRT